MASEKMAGEMNTELDQDRIEELLCQFENQWSEGAIENIRSFTPPTDDPGYQACLTELVRVDMEFCAERHAFRPAQFYFERFASLSDDAECRASIAFEEFRLTNIHAQPVSAEQIGNRYAVDVSDWSAIQTDDSDSESADSTTSTQRLPDSVVPGIGETFRNFHIIGKLGEGAYGTVLLARQDDLADRLIVLKFVPPLSQEHSFLARLQHTNIVPIYSIHGDKRFRAICMPFMGVTTLQDLNGSLSSASVSTPRSSLPVHAMVATTNRLKEQTVRDSIVDARDIAVFRRHLVVGARNHRSRRISHLGRFAATTMAAVAEGLGYAHEQGMVHGDLKPANVLLDDDGNPIILDFHLARLKSEGLGENIGGTLAYMAPEQMDAMTKGGDIDATADIYSAGVMLFEMVTGKLPFDFGGSGAGLTQIIQDRRQPISISAQDQKLLGHDQTAIIRKCLGVDPAQRYQNGHQLAEDLRRHLHDRPLIHAADRHVGNRLRKWAKRHPRMSSASTVSVLSILFIGMLGWWLWNLNRQFDRKTATMASQELVAESELVKLPLTSFVHNDRSHFENAIASSKSLIDEHGWNDRDTFSDNVKSELLEPDQLQEEMRAAMELHFWIAEAYQRIALALESDPGDRNQLLEQARQHNRQAASFQVAENASQGLSLQHSKIEARLNGKPFTMTEISSRPDDSRMDRFMTAFLLRDNFQEALPRWNQLIEEDAQDFTAWLVLGQTHFRLDQQELAQACFTVCVSLEPDNPYARLYRAMSKLKQKGGDIQSAISDLEIADDLSRDDLAVIQNLALAHGMNRNFEKAKALYDRALELGAHETRILYLRSRVKAALGNREEAKQDFERFMNTEPVDPVSWQIRGNQKLKDNPNGAIADYRQSLELEPDNVVTWNNLAHVHSEQLGDLELAIEAMDKVVSLRPQDATHVATRGVLFARQGKINEATADSKAALQLSRTAETCYRVAGIHAQLAKIRPEEADLAVRLLAAAAARDPKLVIRMMVDDPDLEPIKNHAKFKKIVQVLGELDEFSAQTK